MGTVINAIIEKDNSHVRELNYAKEPYIYYGSRFIMTTVIVSILILIPGIVLATMLLLGKTLDIPKSAVYLLFVVETLTVVAMLFITKPVQRKLNKLKTENTHNGYLYVDAENKRINLMSPIDVAETSINLKRITGAHFHTNGNELKLLVYTRTKYTLLRVIFGDTEHALFLDAESYEWLQFYFKENNVDILRFKDGEVI